MSPRALLLFAAAEGSKDKWCEAEVHRIAQGMFWRKNINQINSKSDLYPPLCRDPQKLLKAVKNFSEGRWCVGRRGGGR
jgi:hypothetical protein